MILFSIQYHEVIFQYEVASLCKIALIFHIAKFFHLLTDVEIWWCSTSQVALVLLSQITFVPMPKFCKDIQIEGKTTSKQSRSDFSKPIHFHLFVVKMWFLFKLASGPLFTINLCLCSLSQITDVKILQKRL